LPESEYIIVALVYGGLKMKLPALLRIHRDDIFGAGVVRFEQPEFTVYAAPSSRILSRQYKAMLLLQHLDLAPQPAPIQRVGRVSVIVARHQPLSDYKLVWQRQNRAGKIELIRRLGATIGMVHAMRHAGTGDLVNPHPKPVSRHLAGLIRKNYILLSLQQRTVLWPERVSALVQEAVALWGNAGGTLAGNWTGFPPVKIQDSGLMIMDLSRASYSEPLMDLVNICPQVIGLNDVGFFWEYFLQGYGATCELPGTWKQRINLLYKIRLLQSLAAGKEEERAVSDWESRWWEKL
jgi:hypothetical protein